MPSQAQTAQANHAEAFERHAAAQVALRKVPPSLGAQPDLLRRIDGAPGAVDAFALADAASDASVAVGAVAARIGCIWPDPGSWTVRDAAERSEALCAALAGLPPEDEATRTEDADRLAQDQRSVVSALEAEMGALAGREDEGRPSRVAGAALAVRALRTSHSAPSLDVADALLARLLAERESLGHLGAAWSEVAHTLDMVDGFSPQAMRTMAEQVTALGMEGVSRCLPLPADALHVVEAFERERDEVARGWRERVARHGDEWVDVPMDRLRKTVAYHDRPDQNGTMARAYAQQIGVSEEDGVEAVKVLVDLRDRSHAIECDVTAAKVIGPSFDGARTRCEDLTEALHRWSWIDGQLVGSEEERRSRHVLVEGTILEKARFVELLTGVLAVTVAHEEGFGAGWEGKPSEDDRIDDLTALVAGVDAMRPFPKGADRSNAFATVQKATAVGSRLSAEREVLALLARQEGTDASRTAAVVHGRVREALGTVAGVGLRVADLWRVEAQAHALHEAASAALTAVEGVAAHADVGLVHADMRLPELEGMLGLAGACAERARAVAEAADARAALDDLGLSTTVSLLERAGTPPEEWGRKSRGFVSIPGDRAEPEAPRVPRQPPRQAADATAPRILFAVPPTEAEGHWEEETFPGYAMRAGARYAERPGV